MPRIIHVVRRLAPELWAGGSLLAGAVVSWRRLGSLVIDTGRELEVPRRIAEGDLLYRDVDYYWGPLAPYVNAGLYGMFGQHADVLMWAGLISAILMAAALYWLAARFTTRWVAAFLVTAFTFSCAFARLDADIFNFVLPHNYSAVYGITAATWSVVLLVRYEEALRVRWLAASLALAVLSWVTKIEVAFAVTAAHLLAFLFAPPERRLVHAGLAAGAAILVAAVYGAFGLLVGSALWEYNLFKLVNDASRHYIRGGMGTDDLMASAIDLAFSAVVLGGVAGLAAAYNRWGLGSSRARSIAIGLASAAAFGAIDPQFSLRLTPVLLAVWLALELAAFAKVRRGGSTAALGPLLVIAFGLTVVLRIILQAGPRWYGFYLFPGALLALCVGAWRVAGAPRAGTARPSIATAVLIGGLAGIAAYGLRVSWPHHASRRQLVEAPRLKLYLHDAEAEAVRRLMAWPRGTRAMALPDGAGLVFASGLSTAGISVLSHVPMVLDTDAAERRLIGQWMANPPQVVVWSRRQQSRDVFGVGGMGEAWGREVVKWIEKRYVPYGSPFGWYLFLVPRS